MLAHQRWPALPMGAIQPKLHAPTSTDPLPLNTAVLLHPQELIRKQQCAEVGVDLVLHTLRLAGVQHRKEIGKSCNGCRCEQLLFFF
jgi:hypothetical protein